MNVTQNLSITNKSEVEATLTISGDIGYNVWADTFEDYKKNTSEAMAKELQAIKDLKATTINVEIESLGGDVIHGLAISSLLKQSGATIKTYYRGANASMSTVIGSVASSVNDVYMDSMGLYLIHKPMSVAVGNANDMEETKNSLDKVQKSLERAYLDLGVKQSDLDILMEKNGGHGEWLTFDEAKSFGFVGNEWKVEKTTNYAKKDFSNRKILIPNNLILNNKNNTMKIEEQDKKSLFQEFKNWFKNEEKAEAEATELETLRNENQALTNEVAELKQEIETLNTEEVEETEEVENVEVAEETEEETTEEVEETTEEIVNKAVKEALKNAVKPISETENKQETKNVPTWKKHLNTHNKIN